MRFAMLFSAILVCEALGMKFASDTQALIAAVAFFFLICDGWELTK